ncbi:caspase domain-containing protein [Xylaria intraflava]|nr:caspase domain-containing protein [Xylaria intraflava]
MGSRTKTSPPPPGAIERWALLIGIDYYFPGKERNVSLRPLKGCVRDVQLIQEYLKSIDVPESRTIKLTASPSPDGNGIKEPPEQWPTHENITAKLDYIRNEASKGALVYIHYSGHGILRRKIKVEDTDGGNKLTGTALVLTNVLSGGAYLSGYQLGVKVKRMVESKNLRVTLALDSCHSGHGVRDDDSSSGDTTYDEEGNPTAVVRGIDEVDDSELESDKQANEDAAAEDGKRHADAELSWLDNPHSCTVLTACGVHQTAGEMAFGKVSSERNGVFTHWMLDMLRQYPKTQLPSYSQMRRCIQFKTKTTPPRREQTPGIFGDAMHEFFGPKRLPWVPSCGIINEDGKYMLAAGKAQGVAVGAIYELRPEDREADMGHAHKASQWGPLRVRIKEVDDLRSEAEAMSESDVPRIEELIRLGNYAVLHQWALPEKTYVSISHRNRDGLQQERHRKKDVFAFFGKYWQRFRIMLTRQSSDKSTAEQAFRLEEIKASAEKELETTPNLHLKPAEGTEKADFQIILDENETAEICDGEGKPLAGLPSISLREGGAIGRLVEVLRHAARFQAVKELRYGKPAGKRLLTEEHFSFEVFDANGQPALMNTAGQYEAKHNQGLQFILRPKQDKGPLYVTLFNLTEDAWAAVNLYPSPGVPPPLVEHEYPTDVKIRMTVPERSDGQTSPRRSCVDIVRAYVYKGSAPLSWDELQLHKISSAADEVPPGDHLERLASLFLDRGEDDQWAVVDFVVNTSLDEAEFPSHPKSGLAPSHKLDASIPQANNDDNSADTQNIAERAAKLCRKPEAAEESSKANIQVGKQSEAVQDRTTAAKGDLETARDVYGSSVSGPARQPNPGNDAQRDKNLELPTLESIRRTIGGIYVVPHDHFNCSISCAISWGCRHIDRQPNRGASGFLRRFRPEDMGNKTTFGMASENAYWSLRRL